MRPNCLVLARVVPSEPGLESFSKESNEVELFLSSVSIKLDGLRMLEVRRPIVNFLCSQGSFDCLIFLTLELVPTKADPTTKERSCNWGMVGVSGAGGIEMILTLVSGLRV